MRKKEPTPLKFSDQLGLRLLLRWVINSIALGVSSWLIADITTYGGISTVLLSGLILSAVNAVLKPVVIILSLPAILLSLGFFTIFVNGIMVYVASLFVGSFTINSFGAAILAGMVVALVNYGLSMYLEERIFKEDL